VRQPVIRAEGQYVQESDDACPPHLCLDAPQRAAPRFSQLDDAGQVTEAGHPGAQAVAVEDRSAMADQYRSETSGTVRDHTG